MDDHNFWYWVIEAIKNIFFSFITLLPAHSHWGLASTISDVAVDMGLLIVVYIGKFIDLLSLSRVAVAVGVMVIAKNKLRILTVALNLIKLLRVIG